MNFINRTIVVALLLAAFVFSCVGFVVMLLARNSIAAGVQPTINAVSDSSQIFPLLFCLGLSLLVAIFSILLFSASCKLSLYCCVVSETILARLQVSISSTLKSTVSLRFINS